MIEAQLAALFKQATEMFMAKGPSQESVDQFSVALSHARQIVAGSGLAPPDPEARLPRVFIAMPYLHNVELETAKACFVEFSDAKAECHAHDFSSSLLAHAFNELWCDCLNSLKPFDRWVLCHADIGFRTKYFVDVLMEDMDNHGFDVIHVPMPIKDARGLTSTCIMTRGDGWSPRRRITMTELNKLPDVFDLDDVLRVMEGPKPEDPVLCPNTGVMMVRIAEWCWDFPGFEIRDRIDKDFSGGKQRLVANVMPEDWNFGQWCAKNGLKVGGTKRVKTNHWMTRVCYKNDEIWGEDADECFVVGR